MSSTFVMADAATVRKKVVDAYRAGGFCEIVLRVLYKLARALVATNSAYWFERDLEDDCALTPTPLGVRVNFDAEEKIVDWMRSLGKEYMVHARELEVAREEKHLIGAAECGDEIVGYVKVGYRRVFIQDFGKTMRFPEGVAFIYDTYVTPERRGQGVAGCLIRSAADQLRKRGFRLLRCHIPPWNSRSISAFQKCGFRKVKYIRYRRALGFSIFSFDPERL